MLFILLLTLLFTSCSATINQLSFSGGGSFGAVEIGIIKRLTEKSGGKEFDLYTGISAGALNAGFLSYYKNIRDGIRIAERIYTYINNRMVYKLLPPTGVSVLNTEPLYNTLNDVISRMPGEPVIHTLIGATNLYSGNLDVYAFEKMRSIEDKVHLLMSSSAIPGLFPPIDFNGTMYADGGTLSNELLQVEHSGGEYINITFITPYEGYVYDNEPIDSLEKMIKRTISIVTSNFNNPLATLNQNCANPIGEINKYYVDPALLEGYNILNFDDGKELIDIGYNGVRQKKYKLC
jgi:predicted patatin/cPLA2 family phospholipase